MALLWCDGFDHYGSTETFLLDGPYADEECTLTSSSPTPPTGTHCIAISGSDSSTGFSGLRKVLPTSKDKLGMAARFYYPTLPNDSRTITIDFLSSSPNRSQIRCIVDPNGALAFYRGGISSFSEINNGTLIATSDPVIVAGTWNHIEVQVYIHDTDGWVRAAVNGVHRYEATGLDTKYDSSNIVGVGFHRQFANGMTYYIDDLYVYDFVGDSGIDTDWCPAVDGAGVATQYIGELQCMYLPPNGDTAEADWTKSTGTDGFALVDEVSPNDGDYISSTTAGDLSEFDLTDLPEDITYIRGLQLIGRMSKSDSGAALFKFGMKSDASTDDIDEQPMTTDATYWWGFMNVDPDSSGRWTRDSLNAGKFRLTRSV
jgi:hypothetical protein